MAMIQTFNKNIVGKLRVSVCVAQVPGARKILVESLAPNTQMQNDDPTPNIG